MNNPAVRKRVQSQSPLDRYRASRIINDDLYQAGLRYGWLVNMAGQDGRCRVQPWEERIQKGNMPPDNGAFLRAQERLRRIDAQIGPVMADALKAVCIGGATAEQWACKMGETRKGVGIAFVRIALRVLINVNSK